MSVLLPETKFDQVKYPDLEERDHHHHFVDACLGKAKTESHFGQTGSMAKAIILWYGSTERAGQSFELEVSRN